MHKDDSAVCGDLLEDGLQRIVGNMKVVHRREQTESLHPELAKRPLCPLERVGRFGIQQEVRDDAIGKGARGSDDGRFVTGKHWCLRCLLLVMCTHPFAKEALTLHLARSEGHERYLGCNLMHRNVLASSHQHLMAEALQDYLNEQEEALWGLATNGVHLRLLRDNASLTRPAHIEADLSQIFTNEDAASFAALWLLIHRSRFGAAGTPATDCALERWREAGAREGEAARDRLAGQVEVALRVLGSGFLDANPSLAAQLQSGALSLTVLVQRATAPRLPAHLLDGGRGPESSPFHERQKGCASTLRRRL